MDQFLCFAMIIGKYNLGGFIANRWGRKNVPISNSKKLFVTYVGTGMSETLGTLHT